MREEIRTVEEAWTHLVTRVIENLRIWETTRAAPPSAYDDDDALAHFILSHPDVFEERLLAGAGELTSIAWPGERPGRETALSALVQQPTPDPGNQQRTSLVDSTLRALGSWAGLRLCSLSFWHQGPPAERALWELHAFSQYFRTRFRSDRDRGAARGDRLTPEMRDVLRWDGRSTEDDILPPDLSATTPEDIEAAIAAYVGAPLENIVARLQPGGASSTGFLAPGERLGEIISRDAATLRALGIDRHALADRIRGLVDAHDATREKRVAPPPVIWGLDRPEDEAAKAAFRRALADFRYEDEPPLSVTTRLFMGFQEDPFHTFQANGSNKDFVVQNRAIGEDATLQGGTLTLTLIRRLCFFEGNVPHRIDPARAARILGMIP